MSLLGGCATGSSEPQASVCPPVVEYSLADQKRAAQEVDALPKGAFVTAMLSDYAVLRKQARHCLQ